MNVEKEAGFLKKSCQRDHLKHFHNVSIALRQHIVLTYYTRSGNLYFKFNWPKIVRQKNRFRNVYFVFVFESFESMAAFDSSKSKTTKSFIQIIPHSYMQKLRV